MKSSITSAREPGWVAISIANAAHCRSSTGSSAKATVGASGGSTGISVCRRTKSLRSPARHDRRRIRGLVEDPVARDGKRPGSRSTGEVRRAFMTRRNGQVEGREVGHVAYMLANSEGKSRAKRDGSGRPAARWRTLLLSSGEQSLADKMAEADRTMHAGQEARLIDILADSGDGMGIFETLNGHASPQALATHLRSAVAHHYGTPIRAFLDRLAADLPAIVPDLRPDVQRFAEDVHPRGADGQVQRVAQRSGLVAAAGSLACRMGVLPCPQRHPTKPPVGYSSNGSTSEAGSDRPKQFGRCGRRVNLSSNTGKAA